jgi:cytosolic 5'-nucleotidase 3
MKPEVIISDVKEFEKKKKIFTGVPNDSIHVVADFDRTMTYGIGKDGKRTHSVISTLRSEKEYLGEEYAKKAHELARIYYPIEVDSKMSIGEKVVKMHEWWKKHYNLILKYGLTKDLIAKVVEEKPMDFRKGSLEAFKLLRKNSVPVVFMSASPGDMLIEYLEQNGLLFENVFVIANRYEFDEFGKAIAIKEPIIHVFNKAETSLASSGIYDKIKNKKNVILLGDSLGDVGMAEGFDYDNIIKIGFLNENVKENLEEYKKNFDVVLTNDADFDFIFDLFKGVLI